MARYCYLVNDEDGRLVCTVNHRDYKNCDLYRDDDFSSTVLDNSNNSN